VWWRVEFRNPEGRTRTSEYELGAFEKRTEEFDVRRFSYLEIQFRRSGGSYESYDAFVLADQDEITILLRSDN
jgi:hypothetical protein